MKPFLIVLVLVGAGIAGLGFYMGWFSVDTDKFEQDRKKAVAGVQNLGHKTDGKVAGKSHDGKVVSITGAKLVMTNMEGADEHSHTLTADSNVTCDGKDCKAADLQPGMRVRVTTENAESHTAIRIEALDINRDFEKGA
jgi:hypothetical protein